MEIYGKYNLESLTANDFISGDTKYEICYLTYYGTSGTTSGTNGCTLTSNGNWTVTKFNTTYYVDDSDGDVVITIPDANENNEGKKLIVVKPRLVQSNNTITIKTISGQDVAQTSTLKLNAPNDRIELISAKFAVLGLLSWKYRITLGEQKNPKTLYVSTFGDSLFTTIKSAVDYANNFGDSNINIILYPGEYEISDTIISDLPNLTIQGYSSSLTHLYATTGLSGKPMFIARNEMYLKSLNIDGSTLPGYGLDMNEVGLTVSGGSYYVEINDVFINGFGRGVCFDTAPNSELWLFNSDISDCAFAGVCNIGGANIGISECGIYNNTNGVVLYAGVDLVHTIQNTTFEVNAGQTGIYWNSTGNTYQGVSITGNDFLGDGNYITGINWATSGDSNINVKNNTNILEYKTYSNVEISGGTGANYQTTLTTQNVYYKLNFIPTYTESIKSQINNNRVTFLSNYPSLVLFTLTGDLTLNANTQQLKIAVFKNGSTLIKEIGCRIVTSGQFENFSLTFAERPNKGDYYEIFGINNTSGSDTITLRTLFWVINEI